MERQADIRTTPHLAAPQLTERKEERFAPEPETMGKSGSQNGESGYSSVANSQNYPSSSQGSQRHSQLQSLADAAQSQRAGDPKLSDSNSSRSLPSPAQWPQDRVSDRRGEMVRNDLSESPVSRFAPPPSTPAHPAQSPVAPDGNSIETSRSEGTYPTTPATQAASLSNSAADALTASSSSITPPAPAAVAGSKRTSSGAVKPAVSVPNSPIDVMFSPTSAAGVQSSPRVDPGRIQELSAQLRTRLKYARIKVDNNWTTKSLDQVESIYHSNQNSPAKSRLKRDHERDDELMEFGEPLPQIRRHGHSRTASEPANHFYTGGDSAKTYESFWRERAPFTMKMLEKMTNSGQPSMPNGGYNQPPPQQPYQHQYQQQQQYGGGAGHAPYSHVRSPTRGHPENGQYQQPQYSPGSRVNRPPPVLTPSHSNLSNYSATYSEDNLQPPATPLRQTHTHPSLSRGNSNKSAEEEAVESLMFLMSSPGNNSTPRREPRMVQGYQINGTRRRGSILREDSSNWGFTAANNDGEVDLDVTDAEEPSAEEDREESELPPLLRKGRNDDGYRRRGDGVVRYSTANIDAHSKVRMKQSGHQERVTKVGAGTGVGAKKRTGVGAGAVANGGSGPRKLAPGFSPT
ncbi:hypothetical protein BDZ91DRAFT_797721 [Kalaharituber pfeilii]|nr:hypothetical protein BDZ91DRAFT_797721 [Kalaharituber pfeilii]